MSILTEAFQVLRGNFALVFVYVGATAGINLSKLIPDFFLEDWLKDPANIWPTHTYGFATSVLNAAAISLLQALVFAKLASGIDRPLWRIATGREAAQRFFNLWFILNLGGMSLLYLPGLLPPGSSQQSLAVVCQLAFFALIVCYIPIGSCLMFKNSAQWTDTPRAFAPLIHELPRTLVLLLVGTVQIVLLLDYLRVRVSYPGLWIQVGAELIVGVACAFIECLLFAGTWLICMTHREHGEDPDFDF